MSRYVSASLLADNAEFDRAWERSAMVADETAGKIAKSARQAAASAAAQAKAAGASASEQEAAAARAAVSYTSAAEKITKAQQAAGKAAMDAAKAAGASADEQVAAWKRAVAATGGYEAAQRKAAAAAEESAVRIKGAHDKIASLGKWTIAGGLGAGFFAVKGAAELQKQMEMVHTQAGATQAQLGGFTKSVLAMGGAVGTGPKQLTQALNQVVSALNKTLPATTRSATELKVLRVAAEGAKVGNANLVDVTHALDASLVAGLKGVGNYQHAMGALNATVGAGEMNMQDLSDALGASGLQAIAGEAGLSIKDLGAALATFGDNNVRGAEAGTKLASAIRIMGAPSPAAAKALGAVGLSSLQLAQDMRSGGLIKALEDLKQHLKDAGATGNDQGLILTRAFGGKQSAGVRILLSQLDRMKASYKQVGDGAKNFGADWAATQKTAAFQFDQLKATVQALADKFGLVLIPKLQAVVGAVSNVVSWFGKHKAAAEALAITIGTVLGAAVTVFAYTRAVAFVNATKGMIGGMASLASNVANGAASIEAKLTGVSSASNLTAGKVAGSNAAMEASNATAGASFTTLDTEAGTASVGVGAKSAAMATAVTTADGEIDAANATTGGSFLSLGGKASGLLGVLTKLADIGSITVSVAVVFEAFNQIKNILNSGGNIGKYMTPTAHNLIAGIGSSGTGIPGGGLKAIEERIQASSAQPLTHAELVREAKQQLASTVTSTSPPWQVLGMSKSRYESMSASQKRALTTPGATPGASMPGASTPAQIANYLHAQGLSNVAIAGILGNFAQETGGGTISGINTRDSGTGASGMGGMGLAQWTQGRREQEMAFAKSQGLAPTALAAQLGYLMKELHGGYGSTLSEIQSAKTPGQAASLFDFGPSGPGHVGFEGGTDPSGIRERAAQAAYAWLQKGMKGYTSVSNPGGTTSPTTALQNYLNGTSGTSTGPKATMRYFNHQPVGKMTEAQWQAWQAQNGTAAIQHGGVTGISTTIGTAIQRYQGLRQAATSESVKDMYGRTISEARGYGKTFEERAGKATTSDGEKLLATQLGKLLTALNQHTQAFVRAVKLDEGYAKVGTSLIGKYGNAAQSGTSRTLENALGFQATGRFLPNGGLGMTGAERLSEPLNMAMLHQLIEGGASPRALGSTVSAMTKGSTQNQAYSSAVQNLIKSGQKKEADALVAAHKAAMAALATTLYAEQRTKDGEQLSQQATALKDQTTAIQNAMQSAQTVWQANEQKVNEMASATVQSMQDMQQTVNDQMAGMAQAIKDATQLSSDQSAGIVTAIQDQTQTQVDQIGEKGLYGMNLVVQQLRVQADITKAGYDQQITQATQAFDVLQMQADQQENIAKIGLDQVIEQQHAAVAAAQQALNTVTITQDGRIAAAQAHADAVQLHADATLIGPAQIAVDLNANASKSDQAKFQAQLTAATGLGNKQVAGATQALANVQSAAQAAINAAQGTYDSASNAANQMIQGAQDNLDNLTNSFNNLLATAQGNLQTLTDTAAQTEATQQGGIAVTGAQASTQFAGSGLVINQYGVDLSNPAAMSAAASWGIRATGVATP